MICLVAATDLSNLSAPGGCRNWVIAADPADEIFGHAISVDLDWWSTALADRGLGGGPVTGIAGDSSTIDSGNCQITRGHVFNLAAGAADDPDTALRCAAVALPGLGLWVEPPQESSANGFHRGRPKGGNTGADGSGQAVGRSAG